MRRDTYHDFVAMDEMVAAGGEQAVKALFEKRGADLLRRSGAVNVSNWVLVSCYDYRTMCQKMRVSFDSRGWTG